MTTATLVLIILLWPLCLFIIGLILLQGGAGDISSAFGGGGQLDSTLGVGAGRKMSKLTAWLAGAFLLIVLALSVPDKGDFSKSAGAPAPKTEPKPTTAPMAIPPAATPTPASVPALTPASAAPATPTPVVVPATPAAPTPAPVQPEAALPAAQPAAAPAAPVQSGVKLDEPAKQ